MPNPQDPLSTNDYGPFSEALMGPLQPQQQQPQIRYAPSQLGALAHFAQSFIQGAQAGQRSNYERNEQMKQEHERNFDAVYAHGKSLDTLSPEGKKALDDMWIAKRMSQVDEATRTGSGAKAQKDNPLMHLAKQVVGAVIGPGQNINHKDLNSDNLLSIIQDQKYQMNPRQMGAQAAQDTLSEIQKMKTGQPGQAGLTMDRSLPTTGQVTDAMGYLGQQGQAPAATPAPNSVAALPQPAAAPTTAPPPSVLAQPQTTTPPPIAANDPRVDVAQQQEIAPQQITRNTVGQNPRIAEVNSRLLNAGQPGLAENPYTANIISSIPATGADTLIGARYQNVNTNDGKVHEYGQFKRTDGTTYIQDYGLAGNAATNNGPAMQKVWVQRPGSPGPEYAYINPRHPSGYEDVNGQALPAGTNPIPTPTEGSGMARTFTMMAGSVLARQGVANPTPAQLKQAAGDLAEQYYGSSVARRQQEMAMDAELSGVGAGKGLTTPPPVISAPSTSTPAAPLTINPNTPQPQGMVVPGNIDLRARASVQNSQDPSKWSTVNSWSFTDENPKSKTYGKEVLIPGFLNGKTIVPFTAGQDGKSTLTPEGRAAIDNYYKTGQHLGVFATPDDAESYGQQLHNDWAAGKIPGVAMAKPANRTTAPPPGTTAPITAAPDSPYAKLPQPDRQAADYYVANTMGNQKLTGKAQIKAQKGQEVLQKLTGLNTVDLGTQLADLKANQKALGALSEYSAAFGRVQQVIQEHGKVLEDAATAYGPGNVPLANKTWQWLESNLSAHPELEKYQIAINAVQREYARMISGGVQSRAQLPVSATEKGETAIRGNATIKDIVAAVQQLKTEAETEQKGFDKQHTIIQQKMANNPVGRALNPSSQTSAPPGVTEPQIDSGITHISLKNGTTLSIGQDYTNKAGQKRTVAGFDSKGNIIPKQ